MSNNLPKIERLHGTADTENLFAGKKKSVYVHPLRVVYKAQTEEGLPTRIMVIVPKRFFKHAVDRNHTKRVIRECYRLHKEQLYEVLTQKDCKILLSINYLQDKRRNFPSMEQKYMRMLDRLVDAISNMNTNQ